MAKTREQKETLLASLEDKLERAKLTVLVKYQGLKVKESEELRRKLREAEVDIVVPKNTIAKIALKKSGIKVTGDAFDQPLALAFGYADEVRAAKEIVLFGKAYEAVEILGGIMNKQMIDAATIKQLAALPSREELMARMAGSLSSPARGLATTISGVTQGLARAISEVAKRKQA